MALGKPKRRQLSPTLVALWHRDQVDDGSATCEILLEATMPAEAHRFGGAPATVWTRVVLTPPSAKPAQDDAEKPTLGLDLEYLALNKTSTRLPESIFVQFKPAVAVDGWGLEMFNDSSIILDPMDVMPSPDGSGGAPHTRCVSGVQWQAAGPRRAATERSPSMNLRSKDVPCICTGTPTPFPTPRNAPPNMADGISYNIFNNIWNTNYVLWYPFDQGGKNEDKDMKSRFSLQSRVEALVVASAQWPVPEKNVMR